MLTNQTIYVVEMLRWGDDETHHYIIGVLDTLAEANKVGEIEKSWRGGKYEYRVVATSVYTNHTDIMDKEKICCHHTARRRTL